MIKRMKLYRISAMIEVESYLLAPTGLTPSEVRDLSVEACEELLDGGQEIHHNTPRAGGVERVPSKELIFHQLAGEDDVSGDDLRDMIRMGRVVLDDS